LPSIHRPLSCSISQIHFFREFVMFQVSQTKNAKNKEDGVSVGDQHCLVRYPIREKDGSLRVVFVDASGVGQ